MRKKCKDCQDKHVNEFECLLNDAILTLSSALASIANAVQEGRKTERKRYHEVKKISNDLFGIAKTRQCRKENPYSVCLRYIQMIMVLEAEACLGYPEFNHYINGYLSLASMAMCRADTGLASILREVRLKDTTIDYEGLCEYLVTANICIGNKKEVPELPVELINIREGG